MLMYCLNCEKIIDEYDVVDNLCPLCDGSSVVTIDSIDIVEIDPNYELEEVL